jgi:uncharacterized protein YndB with AHSA1/START domain
MRKEKKANEICVQRLYDAPLAMVWDAWAKPELASQWWGPRGFTTTSISKEFRVGGSWIYSMQGPDGVAYPNYNTFLEVDPHARMVYDHGATEGSPPMFRVSAEFSTVGDQTLLEMTMAFASPEAAIETEKFVKMMGGNTTWDRLAEFLAKRKDGKEIFVIARVFNAPIERLYDAWTRPDQLSRWLAPDGSLDFIRADLRVGGSTFSVMKHGPDSAPMFGRASYLELTKPQRIVYTQQFCDAQELVIRHPMAATWPETKLTTVTMVAESEQRTRLSIQWEPYGEVSPVELATFTHARAGMSMGWTGSLDGLEAYLESST